MLKNDVVDDERLLLAEVDQPQELVDVQRASTLAQCGRPAPHSCNESLRMDQERSTGGVVNPSQTLFYDVLTTEAASKGLVDFKVRRHTVVVEAELYHNHVLNQTFEDFPVVCPNKTVMSAYLEYSVGVEGELLPEFAASAKGEQSHQDEFWLEYEKRRRYCWIDSDTVLQGKEWQDFFRTHVHNCTRTRRLYHECNWSG